MPRAHQDRLIRQFFVSMPTSAQIALFAGIFFSDPGQVDENKGRRRHQRRTPHLATAPAVEGAVPSSQPSTQTQGQIPNPFLDPAPGEAP